jgi:hypothetical protein
MGRDRDDGRKFSWRGLISLGPSGVVMSFRRLTMMFARMASDQKDLS